MAGFEPTTYYNAVPQSFDQFLNIIVSLIFYQAALSHTHVTVIDGHYSRGYQHKYNITKAINVEH
jgi:hypothetical protein